MKMRPKNRSSALVLSLFTALMLTLCPALSTGDSFTVTDQREMALSGEALDLSVSSDGRWNFVLTKQGEVLIYGISGDLVQTLKVGEGYDSLEYSPAGNRLLLSGSGNRKLKILTLSLLYELDYGGSPFKGPEGAPVTIAVFDDFQ